MSWDQLDAQKLREQGLNQEQIGFCIGLIAEHRMNEDQKGYQRGFNNGFEEGKKDVKKTKSTT